MVTKTAVKAAHTFHDFGGSGKKPNVSPPPMLGPHGNDDILYIYYFNAYTYEHGLNSFGMYDCHEMLMYLTITELIPVAL